MAQRLIRIGRVSSVNPDTGMVKVTYPDLDDTVTDELPMLAIGDEYKMPKVRDEVLVLHLSNGQAAGIVIGKYWNKSNKPPTNAGYRKELGENTGDAYLSYHNGTLEIKANKIILNGKVIEPDQ